MKIRSIASSTVSTMFRMFSSCEIAINLAIFSLILVKINIPSAFLQIRCPTSKLLNPEESEYLILERSRIIFL